MGARGNRKITGQSGFTEPVLMMGVDDLLHQAEENGYYNNDSLDIERMVSYVSSTNADEPIVLEYVSMDAATSGSLTYNNGIWTIRVNEKHNRRRQRFTMAHELGHYMMHRNKLQSFTDEIFFRSENKNDLEYKANEFASRLLMPEDRLRRAIASGVKNLGQLAERFEVSSPAMKIRVLKLGFKLKQNE